jgi:hypothetical protein
MKQTAVKYYRQIRNALFLLSLATLSINNAVSQTFTPVLQLDPISTGSQELEGRRMIATMGDSVYVVYEHVYQILTDYYSEIYLKKSTDSGASFSAPVLVVTWGGVFQYGPSICVDN